MINRAHYNNPYRKELLTKIAQLNGQVFQRQDLSHEQSNRVQLRLNRALSAFVDQGLIIKLGHNLYAKAHLLEFANGQTQPALNDSFENIAIEALNKLGVKWELGSAIQAYNRGETTQIPTVFSVILKSRFRGKIEAGDRRVIFEGKRNAR